MAFKNISFIILFFLTACHTAKKSTTTAPQPTNAAPLSTAAVLDKLTANAVDFERMSGEAGIDYKGKPMNIAVSSSVRWRRDSLVWLNVKKMGFNVARVQVTQDSVFVINYLQSSYLIKDIAYAEKNFGVPLSFATMQDILLGNPVFLTDKNKLTVEKSSEGDIILRGSDARWKAVYRLDATNFAIKDMLFEEPAAKRSLKISYKNYATLKVPNQADKNFSYLRTLEMESTQTGKVSVEIEVDAESLEVNVPKNIRFEIPKDYGRMD
ncbi:MAG: DUF4292 domain-containing protein [Saprospiraceae bacterium]|nr:DUF4292 domain-containing protein [Saprospiraceae bacterium]